jgi:predicted 3-demethylubiquinone-9 3-methyltransferase (glyoxalase superfamily)
MADILLVSDIDMSKITFGDLQPMGNQGGKCVPIYYNSNKFIIQTPECRTPFGVNSFKNEKDGSVKYSINLSFGKSESRSSEQEIMFNLFRKLDDMIINKVFENSFKWLQIKCSTTEVLDALYTPLVKYSTDKDTKLVTDKYGPTFKLNLHQKNNNFMAACYDDNAELIPNILDYKTKGATAQAIIQFGSIYFVNKKFGCAPYLNQLQITPPASIQGFAFKPNPSGKLLDNNDESEGEDIVVDIEGDDKKILADSDDDDDDSDEEGVVELPPQPVKKSVKSAKK